MFSKATIKELSRAANDAVAAALTHGSKGMKSKPRTEVGLVAAVTLGAVPNIGSAWEPLLRNLGYTVKWTAVFCHAAPCVDFLQSKLRERCEIADLLVVADLTTPKGVRRRAVLIQAKMAGRANQVTLYGVSSRRQLYLYQNWPAFRFAEKEYGNRHYRLRTSGPDQSGTFGVIDRHLRKTRRPPPRWTQRPAHPTPRIVTREPRLGTFLAKLVDRASGFGRTATPGGTDDWSRVVDLLLRITFAKVFRHRPSLGDAHVPRGVFAFLPPSRPQ